MPTVKKFGPSMKEAYPDVMRTQLWPLCCGAAILSGFKNVGSLSAEDLVKQINTTVDEYIPDMQVYAGEQIHPRLMFLTLNSTQMNSPKIMNAIEEAGFTKFANASPRGHDQGFFVRDKSKTFKAV